MDSTQGSEHFSVTGDQTNLPLVLEGSGRSLTSTDGEESFSIVSHYTDPVKMSITVEVEVKGVTSVSFEAKHYDGSSSSESPQVSIQTRCDTHCFQGFLLEPVQGHH